MSGKEQSKKPAKGNDQPQGGPPASLSTDCVEASCKKKATRFGFCAEHFDQFKFGLIKKNGQRAADYEKKLEHYLAYKEKQEAQKVA